jgi:hypothetical protein
MQSWINSANSTHLQLNGKRLSPDECKLIGDALRCVAGDLSIVDYEYAIGSDGLRYATGDRKIPG